MAEFEWESAMRKVDGIWMRIDYGKMRMKMNQDVNRAIEGRKNLHQGTCKQQNQSS